MAIIWNTTNDLLRQQIYDVLGIGFGPSNLSIAITIEEEQEHNQHVLHDLYLDAQPQFNWHSGMLLRDSRMQVVFLKDLVTMRNPRSAYTFINYLSQHNRLHEFINLRTFYPTRLEFNQYYRWVAGQFSEKVHYQRRVIAVLPCQSTGPEIAALEVVAQNLETGVEERYYAHNLTIGLGGVPLIPAGVTVTPDSTVFHSSECRHRLERLFPDTSAAYRFVVVGSGQTAADILYHLIQQYPNAQIISTLREFAFRPQDDTHFVNELFFPETTDLFYNLPDERRRRLLDRYSGVTHSAVDIDLLPLLYDAIYQDRVEQRNHFQIRRFLELVGAEEGQHGLTALFRDTNTHEQVAIQTDGLILATGYDRRMPMDLLAEVRPYLIPDQHGGFAVERNYALCRVPHFRPHIYLQGYNEHTHGFSEVLLSLLPIRSLQIIQDIVASLCERKLASNAAGSSTVFSS